LTTDHLIYFTGDEQSSTGMANDANAQNLLVVFGASVSVMFDIL